MRIAVAGGTGEVGAHVVAAARAAGHEVRVLTRSAGVDLLTGAGAAVALEGIETVVDVTNVVTQSSEESTAFFTTATGTLLNAAAAAGVRHHVLLSIVGIDRSPYGYYAGKLAQEDAVVSGPVPWTILRATQFHEFAATIYDVAKAGPVHLAPRMRTQPVAAREVAAHLLELATGGPGGRAAELAGPREESLPDMVRAYSRAVGGPRFIPAIPLPGPGGRAQRDGSLLPRGEVVLGRQTFAEWIATVGR